MKLSLVGLVAALALVLSVPAFADGVVDFDANLYTGDVDDTVVTVLVLDVDTSQDTIQFTRHAIDYDTSLLTLTGIVNGDDAPSYSGNPFINWSGSGDAEVIWLGMFSDLNGNDTPWEGDAFELTWTLDDVMTNEPVAWTELSASGCNVNYVDVNYDSGCTSGNLLRHSLCCSGSQCGCDPCGGPSPGECILESDFYGAKFTANGLMGPEGPGSKGGDRPELSPGKAKADRAAWVAAFNVRQELRLRSMPDELEAYTRSLLAGGDPDAFDPGVIRAQMKTWSETKSLYR